MALAQVLPGQLGPLVARAGAARLFASGPVAARNIPATIYETLFDLAVMGSLGLVSALVWALDGGAVLWFAGAAAALILGAGLSRVPRAIARLILRVPGLGPLARPVLLDPGFLRVVEPALSVRLYILSALRFGLGVATMLVVARATGFPVPVWQLAAALPLSALMVAVPLTPAGLGVYEWSISVSLAAFGAPFAAAVLWASASRVIAALAAGLVGLFALGLVAASRLARSPAAPLRPV